MAIVTTQQELQIAVMALEPTIIVASDISLTTTTTINYETIISSSGFTLRWAGPANGTMFALGTAGMLTIHDIILDGLGKYATLISNQGGIFIMETDAILKNVQTNSNNAAVRVATVTDLVIGGSFIMNSGLITGIMLDCAVNINGGRMEMHNDASISDNSAYGISAYNAIVTMTGNSKISNNTASRTGIGIFAINSVIYMGINKGDAPTISNNESLNSYSGGVYLSNGSILNMNYNATISGNKAYSLSGGVGLSDSTLNMNGNAMISENITQNGAGGGIFASAASQINLYNRAQVIKNEVIDASGMGGGIYLQQANTTLTLCNTSSISENIASNGAGIYLGSNTILNTCISDDLQVNINSNIAQANGGGLYISSDATANFLQQINFNNNTALLGNGIYNYGTLNIANDIAITDGLHICSIEYVPTITDVLSDTATIQLEISDHVKPENIPVLVGVKGDDYQELQFNDLAAFIAPTEFYENSHIYVDEIRTQVFIGLTLTIELIEIQIKKIN